MLATLVLACLLFSSQALLEPVSEILYLGENNLCPHNPAYGAIVNGFYVSPIFFFGKPWQLRSVLIDNSTWRLFLLLSTLVVLSGIYLSSLMLLWPCVALIEV
jgi:hypothetical protein